MALFGILCNFNTCGTYINAGNISFSTVDGACRSNLLFLFVHLCFDASFVFFFSPPSDLHILTYFAVRYIEKNGTILVFYNFNNCKIYCKRCRYLEIKIYCTFYLTNFNWTCIILESRCMDISNV